VEEVAELAFAIPGRLNPRLTYWPARWSLEDATARVSPVAWNSSGHLASLVGVDALIRLEGGIALPNPGEIVKILRL
jgi:molybdopterin biosynthesis enzyme